MNEEEEISAPVDIISTLPDEILCRILSSLPTKEAVATSILSKRWIHLWLSVPDINFTDINIDTIESNFRFNESVYSVLASRDAAATSSSSHFIDSFSLEIEYSNPNLAHHNGFPNIVKWINLVVKRRLKNLRLQLSINDDDNNAPKLPISIFNCKTLVSLDLHLFHVEGFSFSSNGFGFPSLKNLKLTCIVLHRVRDLMLLLVGCPILEYLQVFHVSFDSDSEEEDSFALEEFKNFRLPNLIRADMNYCWWSYFPINVLSNSEDIFVDTFNLYTKDHEVNYLQRPYGDIPIFHNLTSLALSNSWDVVVRVLHHCPKIQNLELFEGLYSEIIQPRFEEDWVEPEFVPQCLLSHLRTITIWDFASLQGEPMLPKYILKNAKFLQTMTIICKSERFEIEKKLSSCSKASTSCQLLFH